MYLSRPSRLGAVNVTHAVWALALGSRRSTLRCRNNSERAGAEIPVSLAGNEISMPHLQTFLDGLVMPMAWEYNQTARRYYSSTA